MASDLSRVADAIQFLTENWQNPPSLESLAERYSSSPSHFQRLFSRLTGLSPKQFVLQLSLSDAKERLRKGPVSLIPRSIPGYRDRVDSTTSS